MIKGVIFDLGKVIFDYSLEKTVYFWSDNTEKEPEWYAKNFPYSGIFEKFERGEMEWQDFLKSWTRDAQFSMSPEVFLEGWNNIFLDKYDGIDEILDLLKARFQVVALSNTNAVHTEKWREMFADTIDKFDEIFTSHEIGSRKPERRAFEIVMDHLKLPPDSVLFFDDLPENIKAASEMGIRGHQVEGAEEIRGVLNEIGLI